MSTTDIYYPALPEGYLTGHSEATSYLYKVELNPGEGDCESAICRYGLVLAREGDYALVSPGMGRVIIYKPKDVPVDLVPTYFGCWMLVNDLNKPLGLRLAKAPFRLNPGLDLIDNARAAHQCRLRFLMATQASTHICKRLALI